MFLSVLSGAFALLPGLPWWQIAVGAALAYFAGWLWYGVWFRDAYMPLVENQEDRTNWTATVIQFLGLFMLAYLLGVLSVYPEVFLLGTDALVGVIFFMTLAGVLFQRGNTRDAVRFWLITAGYEVVSILLIAAVIWFF